MSNVDTPVHEVSLKVSPQDRVSSLIVAMLYLVGFVVVLLFLLWLTTRATAGRQQIEVEYLDELVGGEASLGEGRNFEQPGIDDVQDLAAPDVQELLSSVTEVASTTSSSSDSLVGHVSQGHGGGDRRQPGDGGDVRVPRWERWEVRFSSTSLAQYAEQLESFGIELAAAGGGRDAVDYVFDLTKPKPDTRSAPSTSERRLYMSYRRGQLQEFDRQLLQRAGVPTVGRTLLQFYPPAVEGTLAALERRAAGRRPLREIRKTVFTVRKSGGRYLFEVVDQQFH